MSGSEAVKAKRERENAKRREKRRSPEAVALKEQRKAERALRAAELSKERMLRKQEGDKLRARKQYNKLRELIASDPQARERYYARQKVYDAKRREAARAAISPEEKALKLQRAAEASAARLREANAKRSAERLANPATAKRAAKKANKPVDKTKIGNGKKKPGRLLALIGWGRF